MHRLEGSVVFGKFPIADKRCGFVELARKFHVGGSANFLCSELESKGELVFLVGPGNVSVAPLAGDVAVVVDREVRINLAFTTRSFQDEMPFSVDTVGGRGATVGAAVICSTPVGAVGG